MKYFYLVFSSLRRKKLRTLLTMLSIMVAFLLFGYLTAIRQAFDAGCDDDPAVFRRRHRVFCSSRFRDSSTTWSAVRPNFSYSTS